VYDEKEEKRREFEEYEGDVGDLAAKQGHGWGLVKRG